MVFKRRDKLSWGRWFAEGIYPRAGWKRASAYIGHRLKRLPGSPYHIARGLGVGVYISFTPFFGFHFVTAAILATLFRGSILAAILGTFFGNPVTFPFIAGGCLTLGHLFLNGDLDVDPDPQNHKAILTVFALAATDFWTNFKAIFTSDGADWSNLKQFFRDLFLPYLVGGTIPGIVGGVIAYFLSRPLIEAYQKRRKGVMLRRWKERKSKSGKKADGAR
ncbi:MAG: hypothetical protein ACI8YI_000447 [Paracoccaceae bacterium]|jgi:uncharacterized protein (DUF2062 family)